MRPFVPGDMPSVILGVANAFALGAAFAAVRGGPEISTSSSAYKIVADTVLL